MFSLLRICLMLCIPVLAICQQAVIPSPYDYYAHYGKEYTLHEDVFRYLDEIDNKSNLVTQLVYGKTHEGRKLKVYMISDPENLKNLEEIRQSNLFAAGLDKKPENLNQKLLVWMSFGVHGNEAGTTESVLNIIYNLTSGKNADVAAWLKKAVVIIDPSSNPDGNNRYTQFIKSVSHKHAHPGLVDREHMEPWPGGRYNHYLFDLNRDWAWQTQIETSSRIALYNQWMPHIHADFHEMGYNANYYFAPAAEPLHKFISDFQRKVQTDIGKNHAKHFDKNGWLYFTREIFDLFYPSYGDTYPTYNGAVGMTYEQAGHGRSGRAIVLNNGDTLTVEDKIRHNTVVALSTIEESVRQEKDILKQFEQYFQQSATQPKGKYTWYLLKKEPGLARLTKLLDKTGISYQYVSASAKVKGYHYQSNREEPADAEVGDVLINARQPRSVLLQILMEEESELSDSLTYDISAWSLPFVYDVSCYGFKENPGFKSSSVTPLPEISSCKEASYAYGFKWNDPSSSALLASLYKKGYKARVTLKKVRFNGQSLEPGDVVITRADNKWKNNFDQEIQAILQDKMICLPSGFSDQGGDLGGYSFNILQQPKVLLLSGEGTDANSFGEVWYYFENHLDYPISVVDVKKFDPAFLKSYNCLIMPNGYYRLDDYKMKAVTEWVSKGGKLILMENAVQLFNSDDALKLEKYLTDEVKSEKEKAQKSQELDNINKPYQGQERREISKGTAGAIVLNDVDNTHPLGYGLKNTYYSLKTNASSFPMQKNMWNVIKVPENYKKYGFIGHEFKKEIGGSLSFGARNHGQGFVIYMNDNPLFRGFWDKGFQVFSNAVFFMVNSEDGI